MKTLAVAIVFTLVSILGYSQEPKGTTITVTIDQIKNDDGHLLLGLHTSETFMKTDAIQKVKSDIVNGKVVATFTNVKPGTYAIMVMHDENDNNKMDFQPSGMPQESYGLSNNPGNYGPPNFNAASFEVADKDLSFGIDMI